MADKGFDQRLDGFQSRFRLTSRNKALEYYAACLFAQDDAFYNHIVGTDAWEESEIAEYVIGGSKTSEWMHCCTHQIRKK